MLFTLSLFPLGNRATVWVILRNKNGVGVSWQYPKFFIGRNIILIVAVSSSSVLGSPGIIFTHFLTVAYLLFPHYFPVPRALFLTLKTGFAWLTRWVLSFAKNDWPQWSVTMLWDFWCHLIPLLFYNIF